jgi:hypothetical protein
MFAAVRTIQISYDLTRDAEEYAGLLAYLRRHDGTKPLARTWFIRTLKPARKVRDDIAVLTYEDDELLVLDVTGAEWATTFEDCATDWMEIRMPALPRAA